MFILVSLCKGHLKVMLQERKSLNVEFNNIFNLSVK